jgi:hypothetical protein
MSAGPAEDGEQLAAGLFFEQTIHAGVDVGANVREMQMETRVTAFVDDGLRGAIEAEAGEDQVIVAARGGLRKG